MTRAIATLAVTIFLTLTSSLAFAQFGRPAPDLTGKWVRADRGDADSEFRGLPGDYLGLPLNDDGRARADAWMSAYKSIPERQCIIYTSYYMLLGPGSLGIGSEHDPVTGEVVAWTMTGTIDRMPRWIWMDGRPHPSAVARHTPAGFSTGEWHGNTLSVRTTHMTEGVLTLNGVPISSEATLNEYITRHDANLMTITMVLNDPVHLEEPFLKTRVWSLNPGIQLQNQPCEPIMEIVMPFGTVPHYLPGENPSLEERARSLRLPLEPFRGGPETIYPDYMRKIPTLAIPAP